MALGVDDNLVGIWDHPPVLERDIFDSGARPDWATGYGILHDAVLVGPALSGHVRQVNPAQLIDLGGSFAVVVAIPGGIRLVSDRFGSRPLFYSPTAAGWSVSADPWSLVGRLKSPTLSASGALELLAFKYVLGTDTLIEGVSEVPPGSYLDLLDDGSSELHTYWSLQPAPVRRSGAALVDELADVFDVMAARSVRAGAALGMTKWGVNLTAGRDSRVILAGLVRQGVPLVAVSSDVGDDATVAAQLAAAVGVEHHTIASWASSGSPWIAEVADPLVATSMAALAGHPLALAFHGPSSPSGWLSGHLGDSLSCGRQTASSLRVNRRGLIATADYLYAYHRAVSSAALAPMLRREHRAEVGLGEHHLRTLIAELAKEFPLEYVAEQVDLRQRKRRHILRDYLALRALGPTVLWFADPAWADFWRTVPINWKVDWGLYQRCLAERVFVGRLAPLGGPANGRKLARRRLPRVAAEAKELIRRVSKRVPRKGRPAVAGSSRRPSAQELEAVSWLIEPDYFAQPRPVGEVETVRSLARASVLIEQHGNKSA